jgi:riboflavin kinase/FMN adenylyltransferase
VITIGNFDGVHLGHAALLGQVRQLANEMGGPAVAIVLDPHPAAILRPTKVPASLTWIERRAELMDPLGIDALVVCQTTVEFLKLTAAEFFQSLVIGRLGAAAIVEGPNFFFGRDRGGDIEVLKELCRANEIDLRIVQPISVADQMISSTRIRSLLETGNVEEAARLLGGPHRLRGTVVSGARRGRQIGFPTANLTDIDVVVPAPGVYAGIATVNGNSCQAAVHIGPNPTFDNDGAVKVEVHLLDYDGDLYGQLLQVDFITHVRDIARFDSADRLVQQLDRDIKTIRSSLASDRNSRD